MPSASTPSEEEQARRRELTGLLTDIPGAERVKSAILDLYSIGATPVLEAVWRGIGESPMGREYLAVHIHAVQKGQRAGIGPWPDRLRKWLVQTVRTARGPLIFPHSGPMTTIRFMLVEEGFATLIKGRVTIDPIFAQTVRVALERVSAIAGGGLTSA